jgi:nucleotide-binding universal stress UspA family protein
MLVGRSPILTRHIDVQLRGLITTLFMPIFFAVAGLSADLSVLGDPKLAALTLGLICIASLGKFLGAYLGSLLGGLSFREAITLGSGMNARGSTEVIVASIGLSIGVLSQTLYTMIVTMAVLTTMAMPPMLRWALSRVPIRREEQGRLDREAIEAKGFVTKLERILLAVDDSANGRFAAELEGLIAGSHQITTTALKLNGEDGLDEPSSSLDLDHPKAIVEKSAQSAQPSLSSESEESPQAEVTTKESTEVNHEAVSAEAKKGYDLMVMGLRNMTTEEGAIDPGAGLVATGFQGPIMLVEGRGAHLNAGDMSKLNILVASRGTGYSQRAAEVAVALARASRAPLTALYVSNGTKSRHRGVGSALAPQEVVLKNIGVFAENSNVPIRTITRNGSPAEAILSAASSGKHNLIVLGVDRHLGDDIRYSSVAAEVLKRSKCSVILLLS